MEPGLHRQRQRARRKGGAATDPDPTDRGKPGTKRHPVVEGRGTQPGVALGGANRHDSEMLAATLDAVPPMRCRRGRPRRRPHELHADKGHDSSTASASPVEPVPATCSTASVVSRDAATR